MRVELFKMILKISFFRDALLCIQSELLTHDVSLDAGDANMRLYETLPSPGNSLLTTLHSLLTTFNLI